MVTKRKDQFLILPENVNSIFLQEVLDLDQGDNPEKSKEDVTKLPHQRSKKMRHEHSSRTGELDISKYMPRKLCDIIASGMGISSDMVQEILETSLKVAELADSDGRLPLHVAFLKNANNNIINMLIHHFPTAAEVQDSYGNLPFHYACSTNESWHVIKKALDLYPKAIEIKSFHGFLPLHLAWNQIQKGDFVIKMLIEVYSAAVAVPFPDGEFLLSKALCCKAVSDEVCKLIIETYPQAAKAQRNGCNPLHVTLYKRNCVSDDVLKMLIKSCPEAARVQDDDGNLPLHYAFLAGKSNDIIMTLLKSHPGGAQIQNENGELPLHLACQADLSANLIKMLLEIYPKAAKITNKNGELPLHYACWNQKCLLDKLDTLLIAYPESINVKRTNLLNWLRRKHFTLKRAVIKRYSVHLVRLLVKTDLRQCSNVDSDGNFPVHYSCGLNGIDFSPEIVKVLVDASPKSFVSPNNFGKTPKCIMEEAAYDKDEAGMLLLHRLAAFSTELSATAVQFVVDVFPGSITVPDNNGMLPFHHACLNAHCSVEGLLLFLQLYPDCITKGTS